ncbi:MAG: hypothetical protein J6J60_04645 [Clostridia bacterium]|nr:hypothetical protein [Clostridia bacterium]
MEKENVINKKKVIVVVSLFVLLILWIILGIFFSKKQNHINAMVLNDNVMLYSKPKLNDKKIKQELEENTNVIIIESILKDSTLWYKVKSDGKKGYVLAENLDYYKKDKSKEVLVADFSSHNLKNVFKNKNEVQAFLLKYDISYVYIRAGGRGYGEKGNFYTDEKYQVFVEACNYLGIEYGYYFLDEALTDSEIVEEVEFIDNFMKKNKTKLCTLPVALDIESHQGEGRCDDIWNDREKIVKTLLKKLEKSGYDTIVYSNANTCNDYLSNLDTKFWLAYYPEKDFIPDYWYNKTSQPGAANSKMMKNMIGWQFTENGVKHVIQEKTDISLFKSDFFDN